MQSCSDDIADEFDSLSLNSTTTTASTTVDIKHSSSSGSEVTWAPPSIATSSSKPHAPSGDPCWQAIRRAQASSDGGALALHELRFLRRLGSGDIGSVYLVELKCAGGCMFAAKVMDKKELVSRYKEGRARIEREILEMLDHPFLPTLYATLDSPRWSCLLTEFCPGGDLHVLRQRQPDKRFHEATVRWVQLVSYSHSLTPYIYYTLRYTETCKCQVNVMMKNDASSLSWGSIGGLKIYTVDCGGAFIAFEWRPTQCLMCVFCTGSLTA